MTHALNLILKAKNLAILTALLAGVASSAHASYTVDTKIGEARLKNSGEANELIAMEGFAGNSNLALDFKSDTIHAFHNGTSTEWYLDVGPATPGYFLLKFGTGDTNATANTFFFQNIGELTKLVWSDSQVQFLTGGDCGEKGAKKGNDDECNIGRLSHYVGYVDPPTSVPEPTSISLFGLGLLGLTLSAKRQLKGRGGRS